MPSGGKRTTRQLIFRIAAIMAIAVAASILVRAFAVSSFAVTSSSMSPTLQPGDRLLADRLTYFFRKPKRGDIVVFRCPPRGSRSLETTNPLYWPFERVGELLLLAHNTGSRPYVKRVIAVEGETVRVRKGRLYIDGRLVPEPYAVADHSDYGPCRVPEGAIFVMGDNRPDSRDSRSIGSVPLRSIIGRAFFRFWPPSSVGRPRG